MGGQGTGGGRGYHIMRHSHGLGSMGGTGDRGQGDKGLSYHMRHSHL